MIIMEAHTWYPLYSILIGFYSVGINHYNVDGKFTSIHAEVDAVKNLKKSIKNKRVYMIVFRVNKQGKICMSKPCSNCIREIKREFKNKNYRCSIIYYTEQDGSISSLYI